MRAWIEFFSRKFSRLDQSGTAAIEMGIFAPFLIIMIVGTVELGYAAFQATQVYGAVEAGALYAIMNGYNSTGIATAVTSASSVTGLAATPAPSQYCGCPSGTGITAATCGATCAGGNTAGQYIQINATLPRQSFLTNSLGLPASLTATAVVRQN